MKDKDKIKKVVESFKESLSIEDDGEDIKDTAKEAWSKLKEFVKGGAGSKFGESIKKRRGK